MTLVHEPAVLPVLPATRSGLGTRRGDVAALVAGVGAGLAAGAALSSGRATLGTPGGAATTAGAVAALVGTYLCLVLLLLVSRVPLLEREIGQDRLVRWHRRLAPWTVALVLAHVVLTTLGWAAASGSGVLPQAWTIVTGYGWMVPAAAATVLMVSLALASVRVVRRLMRYETWWAAHLYFYLAVVLAFGHQLELGSTFADRPGVRAAWIGLYVLVALALLSGRVLSPLARSWRCRLRVDAVVPEGPGLVSIHLRGRDLHRLQARGGQFFQWRFLTRTWWWQAHPYSLSSAPCGDTLRITVRDLGDQSGALRHLRPGTRVWAEGPYGVFTARARLGDVVTAFAAGVGITPIRALMDDLPAGTRLTLVYRVASIHDVPLRREIEAIAAAHGWRVWYLTGPREAHPLTVQYLTRFAPELAAGDVYICGPDPFAHQVLEAARAAGVPEVRLHHESFAF